MKDYIEREQAIALFYPVDPENDGSDGCTIVYKSGNFSSSEIEAMLMLSDLPAADVAEVRRGCWEEASDGDGVVCSECGTDFCTMIHETEKFRFCPNCGALMKEEEYEAG